MFINIVDLKMEKYLFSVYYFLYVIKSFDFKRVNSDRLKIVDKIISSFIVGSIIGLVVLLF